MAMTLLTMSARGQEFLTKSGTPVAPAERTTAPITLNSKSSTPLPCQTAGIYIAVTRPDLLAALEPMLQWKRQEGYTVETLCVETNHRDSIQALLQERYDNATTLHPAQRYVLLVGDVDRIQAFNGQHMPSGLNTHVTDLYYGEYTGDYLPEAMVGRLSVRDSEELSAVVQKIIDYEQGRWAASSQLLLAAGREDRSPAPTTTNGQVHYVAGLMADMLDTVCFYNPASDSLRDELLTAIGEDNALISYTGHCTRTGWNNPTIGIADIDSLGSLPTVYINNCCLSNAFNGTCFGEQLLRMPEGGAAGVIGATNETLWAEDYYWAVGAKYPLSLYPPYNSALGGAFDGLAGSNGCTLGEMLYSGCQAVTLAGSPFDAFYWETYCLLGDPAMAIFAGTPDTLFLNCTDTLIQGHTQLALEASPGCRISVTQGGSLLGSSITLADSIAEIHLSTALLADSVTMTATRAGAISKSITLPTIAPASGQWAITCYQIDSNDILTLNLQNIGHDSADGHIVRVYQTEEDVVMGTILNEDSPLSWNIDSAKVLCPLPVIGTRTRLLALHVDIADDIQRTYCSQRLIMEPPCQAARYIGFDLMEEELLPRHEYHLEVTLSQAPDSIWMAINGVEYQPVGCDNTAEGQQVCHYIFLTDDSQEPLHIESKTMRRGWRDSASSWMLPYQAMERFETADFSNFPWQNSPLYPWQIDSTVSHGGRFSARSAAIGNGLRSVLSLDIDVMNTDSISFYIKVSSEANDWLYFFLDGKRRGYWSGNNDWQYYTRPLSAGRHRLQWIYQKDASGSNGYDCAWVDDIHLPAAWWQQPCGIPETDSSEVINIKQPTPQAFSLYPNPANNSVTINIPQSNSTTEINIFDSYGRLADRIIIPQNCPTKQYFTTHLRSGIYTLTLHTSDGISVRKLIISR